MIRLFRKHDIPEPVSRVVSAEMPAGEASEGLRRDARVGGSYSFPIPSGRALGLPG